MIEVKGVGLEFRQQWNEYLEQNPHAIAWQAFDWSAVVSRHYQYQFLPLAAFENGKLAGILPLYQGLVGRRKGLISVPFAVAGGILGDNDPVRAALLMKAVTISEQQGGIPITLKQYKLRIAGDLHTDETYFNRELSLQRDPESLREQVNPANLALAELAQREGLEVEYPSTNIAEFYNLLLRHHSDQGVPCVGEAWIRSLINMGLYSFALARSEGRLVAATMVKKFKKTVSFPFSCVAGKHKTADAAAYGLYWNLINRFAQEGFEIFHSGRIPKSQSVVDFRLGWGGIAYPYYYQSYPNLRGRTEQAVRHGFKRRLVSTMWKGLPLGVARHLGPMIVRQFP